MNRFLLLATTLLFLSPAQGWAQRAEIAAIVNDGVVSTADLQARTKLAMLASGMPDTPEVRQRLAPQILRSLIDEQLELQEAKRLDITISKAEIAEAMKRIAADNHIQGDMASYLAAKGGSPAALTQQIKAGLSWGKVVQRELRPHVEISESEIASVAERLSANAGKEQYLVSEIFLSVDSPKDEDQVHQFALHLVEQLKKGANFGAVARQFSQGTGAASGGDIGWVQDGQLPDELNKALGMMGTGEVAGPIRTTSGYHIIGLRDKRVIAAGKPDSVTLELQQIFRPFKPDEDKTNVEHEAEQLRQSITSCAALKTELPEKFPAWHWQDLGDVNLAKTPPLFADKVRNLEIGKASEAVATDKGAIILYVCGRKIADDKIDRDAIRNSIGMSKLELQARRLLRDLRRSAYLDVRIKPNS